MLITPVYKLIITILNRHLLKQQLERCLPLAVEGQAPAPRRVASGVAALAVRTRRWVAGARGSWRAAAARAHGTGTERRTPGARRGWGAAGTARRRRVRAGIPAWRAVEARAWRHAAAVIRSARTDVAAAPETRVSYRRPTAPAGTDGSVAPTTPAGPAPRWGGSRRSSDVLLTNKNAVIFFT